MSLDLPELTAPAAALDFVTARVTPPPLPGESSTELLFRFLMTSVFKTTTY
jgi:hypothetical protein